MKKLFLAVATVAMFASCSTNELGDVAQNGLSIEFSTLNDKVTRVANDGGANYHVLSRLTTGATQWYINEEIKGDNNTIISGKEYYYPANATLDFFAYAPKAFAGSSTATVVTDGSSAEINYTVPTAANEDFTVATPVKGKNSGAVALAFNHMLSRMEVSVDLAQEVKDAGYTIEVAAHTVDFGTLMDNGTVDVLADNAAITAVGGSATYTGAKTYMFVPQSSIGKTIAVKGVKIKRDGVDYFNGDLKVYTIAAGNIPAVSTGTPTASVDYFGAGINYAIKLTIGFNSHDSGDGDLFGSIITFTSSAATWNTGSGSGTIQ